MMVIWLVLLTATFAERTDTGTGQTILGSTASNSLVSTASSTVSAVQSSIQLDSDDTGVARLQVSTDANDPKILK